MFFSKSMFCQDFKFININRSVIDDSSVYETRNILILNNTSVPLCISVSTSFRTKMLNRDTIELAQISPSNSFELFDLQTSLDDVKRGFNDNPSYPLILYPKAAFFAIIKLKRKISCKNSWLKLSLTGQKDINYNELSEKFENGNRWKDMSKLKLISKRIDLNMLDGVIQ